MSITTEPRAAVASWLARNDLAAQIPDFITLFEAAACCKLRVRPTEMLVQLTPVNGEVALPGGFLGVRRLTWGGAAAVGLD